MTGSASSSGFSSAFQRAGITEQILVEAEPIQRIDEHKERMDRQEFKSFKNDRKLRKKYATHMFVLLVLQVAIADLFFFLYAQFGRKWDIDATVMSVWLSATVVQMISIVAIVTRYLFPKMKS